MDAHQVAIERLKDLQGPGDPEGAHCEADTVLCELLKSLGYGDIVEEFAKIEKWYA